MTQPTDQPLLPTRSLAPEQTTGGPPTALGDLYSVGAVCFEMLAGRPAFGGATAVAVALAHVTEPLPDLRLLRPEVPAAIAAVVERALAKDPAARWADAATMRGLSTTRSHTSAVTV